MNYILTLDSTTKRAYSLAGAKALAPSMFARMGTQVMFKKIVITEEPTGNPIGLFGRKGWVDVSQPAIPETPA